MIIPWTESEIAKNIQRHQRFCGYSVDFCGSWAFYGFLICFSQKFCPTSQLLGPWPVVWTKLRWCAESNRYPPAATDVPRRRDSEKLFINKLDLTYAWPANCHVLNRKAVNIPKGWRIKKKYYWDQKKLLFRDQKKLLFRDQKKIL